MTGKVSLTSIQIMYADIRAYIKRCVPAPDVLPCLQRLPVAIFATGVYDWAGQLDLSPDPFTVWSDTSELLTNSSSSNRHRSLLQQGASSSRLLLQAGASSNSTGTGNVPVQGRVAVRETGSGSSSSSNPVTAGSSAAIALDDSGDIMVLGLPPADVCQANPAVCPADSLNVLVTGKIPQPGAAESSSTGTQPAGGLPKLQIPGLAVSPKVLIVIAALAGPTALALCAMGIVAGVLHRKRKRQKEEQQQAKQQHEQAAAAAEPHVDAEAGPGSGGNSREGSFDDAAGSSGSGPVRGSAVRRRISSTAVYASQDGTHNSSTGSGAAPDGQNKGRNSRGGNARFRKRAPGANSGATLEHSANGSPSSSPGGSSGELEDPSMLVQRTGSTTVTEVQFLEVGETGFGSVCGGVAVSGRSVTARSNRGSIDLQSMFEPAYPAGPRLGKMHRQQQQQNSLVRSSLTGMANGIRSAVNGFLRSSQAGAAYKVPKAGEAVLRSSLDYPMHGMGERGPTLPGARRGSVDVPAAAAADYAAKAAGIAATSGAAGGVAMLQQQQQQQQVAPAATSAQLQRSVPAKWLLPTAGITAPAAAAAPTGTSAAYSRAASTSAVNSFFAVSGGLGPNGVSTSSNAADAYGRGSLEQQQQQHHETADAAAAAVGTFMTPSRWRQQQQQQPGAGGSPRSPPGVNFTVWDSPLFK
jgi:hypothetical protein